MSTVNQLMAMAAHYRAEKDFKRCIHCCLAVLKVADETVIGHRHVAHVHLQLGIILYEETTNADVAKSHLQNALQHLEKSSGCEDIYCVASVVLSKLLRNQNCLADARSTLEKAIARCSEQPLYYSRILFELLSLQLDANDYSNGLRTLRHGLDYAMKRNVDVLKLLFRLSEGIYHVKQQQYTEAMALVQFCRVELDKLSATPDACSPGALCELRVMLLMVHFNCAHHLDGPKKSRLIAKDLQKLIPAISSISQAYTPLWLQPSEIYVLILLMTAEYNMSSGFAEKALYYCEKSFKILDQSHGCGSSLLEDLLLLLLQQSAMCNLIKGKPSQAIQQIFKVWEECQKEQVCLLHYTSSLHTLLALYAVNVDQFDTALSHFKSALKHSLSAEQKLYVTINIVLLLISMRTSKSSGDAEVENNVAKLKELQAQNTNSILDTAACAVLGYHASLAGHFQDAKALLRQSAQAATNLGCNSLQAFTFLVLGSQYLAEGTGNVMDMVKPAHDVSAMGPNMSMRVWALQLQAGLLQTTQTANPSLEAVTVQAKQLLTSIENDKQMAVEQKQHSLAQHTARLPSSLLISPGAGLISPGAGESLDEPSRHQSSTANRHDLDVQNQQQQQQRQQRQQQQEQYLQQQQQQQQQQHLQSTLVASAMSQQQQILSPTHQTPIHPRLDQFVSPRHAALAPARIQQLLYSPSLAGGSGMFSPQITSPAGTAGTATTLFQQQQQQQAQQQ
eukprot:scpid59084/ scgid32586/ MAU2 chromatid cohesion factor homolog; Cohesin loading complex subunit SCC4 homolog